MTRLHPPHDLRDQIADMDEADRAALLRDLARAKAVFQIRAIQAPLELPRGAA